MCVWGGGGGGGVGGWGWGGGGEGLRDKDGMYSSYFIYCFMEG